MLGQSSSLPAEGTHTNEEANHTDNSVNSDTQEGSVVGKCHSFKHLLGWFMNLFSMLLHKLYIILILTDAMTDLDIQELANLTAGDADADNFERLFTKLKEMKGNWDI